jgi:hypothetical protein
MIGILDFINEEGWEKGEERWKKGGDECEKGEDYPLFSPSYIEEEQTTQRKSTTPSLCVSLGASLWRRLIALFCSIDWLKKIIRCH